MRPMILKAGNFDIELHVRKTWGRGRGELQIYDHIELRAQFFLFCLSQLEERSETSREFWELLEQPRKVSALAEKMSIWDGGTLADSTLRVYSKEIREEWASFPTEWKERFRP